MSSTLAQLRARIQDDLLDSYVTDAQTNTAINRAIIHYQSKPVWFTQTSGTFATVADQQSYTTSDGLADDILQIDYMEYAQGSNLYKLRPTTFNNLQAFTSSSADNGQPFDFAWGVNKLWLYPIPDAAYTVTYYYRKKYDELSADGDNNDWTNNAEDLIEARATWWLHNRITKDKDEAQVAKAEEMEALKALHTKERMLQPANRLVPTSF